MDPKSKIKTEQISYVLKTCERTSGNAGVQTHYAASGQVIIIGFFFSSLGGIWHGAQGKKAGTIFLNKANVNLFG